MSKTHRIQHLDIFGPCALESREQMVPVLELAKKLGITYVRAQVFKPRTNPDSFQGLGQEGILLLQDLKQTYPELKFVCEVCSEKQFEAVKSIASIIQIGARNMQNFELLKYIAQKFDHDYVLLKRGFANTYKEWMASASYLMKGIAKDKLILCERGSRSISSPTGVSLDFMCALKAHKEGFQVIVDPSHGTKDADYVLDLATAAKAMGFAGVMLEAHPEPAKSVSDAVQALSLEQVQNFFTE